jgi:hypothetical protein
MQDLFINNPDPAPKSNGREKKLHDVSNRLKIGPETIKRQ